MRDCLGLIVTNHLLNENLFENPGEEMSPAYLGENGFITQCCHCRKIKNWKSLNKWDWVPVLVAKPNPLISHTFCPYCLEYYYNIDKTFCS